MHLKGERGNLGLWFPWLLDLVIWGEKVYLGVGHAIEHASSLHNTMETKTECGRDQKSRILFKHAPSPQEHNFFSLEPTSTSFTIVPETRLFQTQITVLSHKNPTVPSLLSTLALSTHPNQSSWWSMPSPTLTFTSCVISCKRLNATGVPHHDELYSLLNHEPE